MSLSDGGPAPHGAGGLKSALNAASIEIVLSRPARGGWIEICELIYKLLRYRPAPHGAGGLKYPCLGRGCSAHSRPAPHGAGGLKYSALFTILYSPWSRPARGGWIEIQAWLAPCRQYLVPPRTGRVD